MTDATRLAEIEAFNKRHELCVEGKGSCKSPLNYKHSVEAIAIARRLEGELVQATDQANACHREAQANAERAERAEADLKALLVDGGAKKWHDLYRATEKERDAARAELEAERTRHEECEEALEEARAEADRYKSDYELALRDKDLLIENGNAWSEEIDSWKANYLKSVKTCGDIEQEADALRLAWEGVGLSIGPLEDALQNGASGDVKAAASAMVLRVRGAQKALASGTAKAEKPDGEVGGEKGKGPAGSLRAEPAAAKPGVCPFGMTSPHRPHFCGSDNLGEWCVAPAPAPQSAIRTYNDIAPPEECPGHFGRTHLIVCEECGVVSASYMTDHEHGQWHCPVCKKYTHHKAAPLVSACPSRRR